MNFARSSCQAASSSGTVRPFSSPRRIRAVGRESEAHPAFNLYFGQKFPVAFRSVIEKKNVPPGTKARMGCGMIAV
jgi:hypothetical protein